MCRLRSGVKRLLGCYASSVMLLDCAKLKHWRCEEQFNELFTFERDYMAWISLKLEPKDSIALFENEWNDFDRLSPQTKMLHNTGRLTQPWKTGLPIDFTPADTFPLFPPVGWVMRWRRRRIRRSRAARPLPPPSRRQPGAAVLRPAARVRGNGLGQRGRIARGNAPQARSPRRLRDPCAQRGAGAAGGVIGRRRARNAVGGCGR